MFVSDGLDAVDDLQELFHLQSERGYMAVDEPALDPLLVFNPNMCCAETLDRE